MDQREPKDQSAKPGSAYEATYRAWNDFAQRQRQGRVFIREEDALPETCRQGKIRWYLNPAAVKDTALQNWLVFTETLESCSGKHIHQGGLALFILEGKGYTVIDGEKVEWEEGDLLMLPVKPGGVEHQHFNAQPGKPCRWMAFIHLPSNDLLGSGLRQVEEAPEWKDQRQA